MVPGAGLDPCGPLPTRDIRWFCDSRFTFPHRARAQRGGRRCQHQLTAPLGLGPAAWCFHGPDLAGRLGWEAEQGSQVHGSQNSQEKVHFSSASCRRAPGSAQDLTALLTALTGDGGVQLRTPLPKQLIFPLLPQSPTANDLEGSHHVWWFSRRVWGRGNEPSTLLQAKLPTMVLH